MTLNMVLAVILCIYSISKTSCVTVPLLFSFWTVKNDCKEICFRSYQLSIKQYILIFLIFSNHFDHTMVEQTNTSTSVVLFNVICKQTKFTLILTDVSVYPCYIYTNAYFWHLRHRIWYCFDNYFTYFVPVFKYCYSDSRNLWTVMRAGGLAP